MRLSWHREETSGWGSWEFVWRPLVDRTAAVPLWLEFEGGNKEVAEEYCMQVYGEGLNRRPGK